MSESDTALARLSHEMAAAPFHDVLRPEAVSADPEAGTVTVRLAFRPEFGGSRTAVFYHGGVIASLIDLTAHAAIAVKVGRTVPTIDLRIDCIRPAPGVTLTAVGRLVSAGRSIGRADVDVHAEGRLVATGRGTFSTLER